MKQFLLFILALLAVACEKPMIPDDATGKMIPADANVILHFKQFEQESFGSSAHRSATRAATDITELC